MFAVITSVELPARPEPAYWALSRGPLASLAFIAPLLVLYELGVVWLGPQAVRNGADVWLRGLLDVLGFGQYYLLPGLTVGLLLVWHHLSGDRWRLPTRVFGGMWLESMALALCLVMVARAQSALLPAVGIPVPAEWSGASVAAAGKPIVQATSGSTPAVADAAWALQARLIAFLGAGIYEEVLFRLLLLPLVIMTLARLGASHGQSVLWAVVATSLIFSAAHYIGPQGDAWQAYSFAFRTLAGGFFAVLFVYRGFGITAGAHAGYDILVGLY